MDNSNNKIDYISDEVLLHSIENIKWAKENGCPWNEYICSKIASQGNLDVLKWAKENGYPWDKLCFSRASENGHLHINMG